MKQAQELLRILTERYPPDGKMRHGFTLDEEGRLEFTFMHEGAYRSWSFEPDDLERSVAENADELGRLFEEACVTSP